MASPKKGDIVLYYCSKCSVHWCHVGIMLDSTRSVEGNYGEKVSHVKGAYRHGDHSLANGIVTRRFVRPTYDGISLSCDCSESYKGNYIVTTSQFPLNMAKGTE